MKCDGQCLIFADPERFAEAPIQESLDHVAELGRDDMGHWWRHHLACKQCKKGFFFEFWEEIDWSTGNDPQLKILVPIEDNAELQHLSDRCPGSPIFGQRYWRSYWPSKGDKVCGWIDARP
ncbi:MAG: hypothetical protein AAF291_01870 [Pseudomonadota bacterium]